MTIDFDPNIFSIGPLTVRWYGLMYVLGFYVGTILLKRLNYEKILKISVKDIEQYVFYLIIGLLIGARLIYVFVYNFEETMQGPWWEIFAVWHGGLSFHGAVMGMAIATYLFAKKHNLQFFQIADCMAIAGSPGLFFGRMGNFINGELYGRVTDSPLGMIFPAGGPYPRHPSQLYEGILEGVVLFTILWIARNKVPRYGIISTMFMAGYGIFRFIVEFFREPDSQLGFFLGGVVTMGQILCFSMLIVAVIFWLWSKKVNLPMPNFKK